MDSSEVLRFYRGQQGSPAGHGGMNTVLADTSAINNNYEVTGHPSQLSRSPSHISHSPSRIPSLLHPPPGLNQHIPSQFGGYPTFDNNTGIYSSPPGFFHSLPQTPLYQNGYEHGHFGGCGGIGGELEGVYSYINMGLPMHQEQQPDYRFPPYSGRKLPICEILPDDLDEGKMTNFCEPMIDNNSGGMDNASAGTYTHFGPMSPLLNGLVRNNNNNEVEYHQQLWAQQFDLNAQHEEQEKRQTPQINKFISGFGESQIFMKGENNTPCTSPSPSTNVIGSGKVTPENGGGNNVKRALTPNGTTPSYSACLKEQGSDDIVRSKAQAIGKPSYLEILTKNSSTNGMHVASGRSSVSSTEQSQSPIPTGDSDMVGPKRDSPSFTTFSNGHAHQLHILGGGSHRKSSDGFIVLNSSPGTSNSSTASSSPITKPKIPQKGKENYLTGFIKPSKSYFSNNGNCGTPTRHVSDKKGQTGGLGNGKQMIGKFKSQKFEFEIDYLHDDEDDGDGDGALSFEPETEERSCKKKGKERKFGASSTNGNINGNVHGKTGVEKSNNGILGLGLQFGRKSREKTEKPRSRREERNCLVRRFRLASKQWLGHLISALTWLWSLIVNVATLSAAVGYGLSEDFLIWWRVRAVPWLRLKSIVLNIQAKSFRQKFKWKEWLTFRKKEPQRKTEEIEDLSDLLAVLGPERNIVLPANGDEALRRLQSVKGQDPYSILGVRSNSPDEIIRRYYKKQAVLVHPDKNLVPGAEEAFKILARAFELVGEPVRRMEYHKQLLEAHAKERFMGEFGNLFEQLRKKLESACTTIRCTKCNARHKKNRTNRPLFAARYCSQCRIHHGAREGELWAEKSGLLGFWTYYACIGNQIWEINEWGKCQNDSLKHLNANSHTVLYRLVSGQRQNRQSSQSSNSNTGGTGPTEEDLLDPEIDDWDNLINNLCRGAGSAAGASAGSSVPSSGQHKGSSNTATYAHSNGSATNTTIPNGSTSAAAARKRKGKRK